ncbi:MAG TPA: AMP-binding protein [Pseudonocardiaceae bacterium]|jgi:2-furoate---CoA ligase|nr:AMP-binding protein [Pseudonocardiaceae bacterium]
MDVGTALTWAAERYPDRTAVGGPRPLTYRHWDAHTNQLARALAGLGVGAGDRVALLMAGGEPMASLHLALQKLGAVSVPLSIRFGGQELQYCLADADVRLLVTDQTTAPTVPGGFAHRDAADLARLAAGEPDHALGARPADTGLSVLLYTSGTTGRPKGVPRTHQAEHAAAVAHVIQARYRPGEITLGVMPLFHTMGLRNLIGTVVVGGTWVPQPKFDAEEALGLIERDAVSSLYLVPTIYWALLHAGPGRRLDSVRRLAYAGATMTPALAEDLIAAIRPDVFVNHVGSTEVFTFTVHPDVPAKPGCAGRAGVFSRVRLISPEPGASPDDLVAPGEPGQIVVSLDSPEAFGGYWHRPDADAKAIRDGWYLTGDLAVADEDGDIWVAGRADDMINTGGENVYPDEIEAALVRCADIADVVVLGLPDDRWGQAVTAFVVPADGVSPEAAVTAVHHYAARSGLPRLKQPKRVIAVAAIPKSPVGKILRRTLAGGDYTSLAAGNGQVPA